MKGTVDIAGTRVGKGQPLAVIAGPCVIESEAHALKLAETLARLADDLGLFVIFKASFDKANRTSLHSYRGPGLEVGLEILAKIRAQTGLAITTDVHLPDQVGAVGAVVDLIQIPAFLCRQTDLLLACRDTGKPVNVKKGQFLAPSAMAHVADKLGGEVLITERGSSFGHQDLVVDLRSVPTVHALGLPVVYDATHSVQRPGSGPVTGGSPEFVLPLARAAVAAGADVVFAEVHDDPPRALSDAATQLHLDRLPEMLHQLLAIADAVGRPRT